MHSHHCMLNQIQYSLVYFSTLLYVPYSLKGRQSFMRLEYVLIKKGECLSHYMLRPIWPLSRVFIFITYKRNGCSSVVPVIVLWLIFVPSVCTCNMWCSVMFFVLYCNLCVYHSICLYLLVDVISSLSLCVLYCLWWWNVLYFYVVLVLLSGVSSCNASNTGLIIPATYWTQDTHMEA
jgi:hypothetical protein